MRLDKFFKLSAAPELGRLPSPVWLVAANPDPLCALVAPTRVLMRRHSIEEIENLEVNSITVENAFRVRGVGADPSVALVHRTPNPAGEPPDLETEGGEKWFLRTSTRFTIGGQKTARPRHYSSIQEHGIWVSNTMSGVTERTVKIVDDHNKTIYDSGTSARPLTLAD